MWLRLMPTYRWVSAHKIPFFDIHARNVTHAVHQVRQNTQWRRSVIKSEGVRVSQVKPSNSKPTEIRFRFRRRKWAIWSFSAFSFSKISFYYSFSFQKCHLRWAKNVMFSTEPQLNIIIRLRPKMTNAFSVGLNIKLFQIILCVNDFQTLNNPGSGQPVDGSKN